MRNFKEFDCKFCDENNITGEKEYSIGPLFIDISSIVAFNECTDSNYINVYLSAGETFCIKQKYEVLKKLVNTSSLCLNGQS